MEGNYSILRRVYQQLHLDITELFSEFINSLNSYERHDMDADIKTNGWEIKITTEVEDAQELMKIFQDFYTMTGRLPLSNSLLVVPDGDAPPDEKVNMRQLYNLYKNTKSHGIVSLHLLGLLQYYLEENNQSLTKNGISELYFNLGYSTLSGDRDFNFDAVSDLTPSLSILLKHATLGNQKIREIENEVLAQKINGGRVFEPKTEDPLDDVVEVIDVPDVDHKKTMHPYEEPTVQTADEIDKTQEIIDTDFIDLKTLYNKPGDVAAKQKKEKKIETIIDDVLNDKNPFYTFDDFWWEEDVFSKNDSPKTVDASKDILSEIQEMSDNILRNLRPVDNWTKQEKIDNQFISIDDRTQQELKDDDYLSLESEKESNTEIENIDTTNAWDPRKTTTAKSGSVIKLSIDYNKKIKAANKIKNKYLRKKIGQREKSNKISADWLKATGYLDTKDQDKINYIFVPPKKEDKKNISGDAGHFVRTEIDSADFKKENLASKTRKSKKAKNGISQLIKKIFQKQATISLTQ